MSVVALLAVQDSVAVLPAVIDCGAAAKLPMAGAAGVDVLDAVLLEPHPAIHVKAITKKHDKIDRINLLSLRCMVALQTVLLIGMMMDGQYFLKGSQMYRHAQQRFSLFKDRLASHTKAMHSVRTHWSLYARIHALSVYKYDEKESSASAKRLQQDK